MNGYRTSARFREPSGIAIVPSTHALVVADAGNHCIRIIDVEGMVSTLAGNGVPGYVDGRGEHAQFHAPNDVLVCARQRVWVADTGNHVLRVVHLDQDVATPAMAQDVVSPCRLAWRAQDILVVVEEAPETEALRCFELEV